MTVLSKIFRSFAIKFPEYAETVVRARVNSFDMLVLSKFQSILRRISRDLAISKGFKRQCQLEDNFDNKYSNCISKRLV